MRNSTFKMSMMGAAVALMTTAPVAYAQPLVTEDGATHVAHLGAQDAPVGTVWFRLDAQNESVNWTVDYEGAGITAATISCPDGTREVGRDYTDPEVALPQFALAEPTVIDTPVEGQMADVDPAFFEQLVDGQCYVSIETDAGIRYNGQIVDAR